jgi:antitoxin component YwqK of YwqJK toxin-antitoxin module
MKLTNYVAFCLIIIIVVLFACTKKQNEITYYDNGKIKSIVINNEDLNNHRVEILFHNNGEIKEIHRYGNSGLYEGEQMWFYQTGKLEKKIPLKNGKANGNGYYFYDITGTLNGQRHFRNDKEVFFGAEYWEDSIMMLKSSIYFNDSGKIYRKKNFDKNGNLINEEFR